VLSSSADLPPEDGGDKFFRNVGSHVGYTAKYLTRGQAGNGILNPVSKDSHVSINLKTQMCSYITEFVTRCTAVTDKD
jgi:hypothetical protein